METSNLTGNAPRWVKHITECYQYSEWEKVYCEIQGYGKSEKLSPAKKKMRVEEKEKEVQ
ncbi:hypothetical protein [Brazilian marseillevirus]|uniref:hypothetical protein n=1 Tax=Brazilian marseillevirus TaxID=1813599 RepID=UPI00078154E7|nr:hypothetical protein A3303_gp002 [Brazilian marseillevirus]AMQ10510.1 hypothetical protein [Brazilian marseillevirus]